MPSTPPPLLPFLLLAVLAAISSADAGDWPRFRGPEGCGITDEKDLPTRWDAQSQTNVHWKTPLPKCDAVLSSPVVIGDRVIITYALAGETPQHHVTCFASADGQKLWDTSIEPGPLRKIDPRGGFAAPTPCSDGSRIYAAFASGAIAALDMEGKLVWRSEMPSTMFDVVMGNSPVLYGDHVILINDQNGGKSQFLAWKKSDGTLALNVPRPGSKYAHSTPILAKIGGKDQFIASASGALQGIDPATGDVLWQVKATGETASAAYDGGLVYADDGRGGTGVSVLPGGQGDITAQAIKAHFKVPSDLGSPVVLGQYVYRQSGDKLYCMDLTTGQTVYTKAIPGASNWASPFATRDGMIYVGTSGVCYVFKAGPAGEQVSANRLGDDSAASAAVSSGRIYYHGKEFLWCIGAK